MEKGFNSDLEFNGQKYHIQTEDWGHSKQMIVSTIFRNGAVLKTHKVSYAEIFQTSSIKIGDAIRTALRRQHHEIIDNLSKFLAKEFL